MKRRLVAVLAAAAAAIGLAALQVPTASAAAPIKTWKSVSAAGDTTCAIDTEGALYCWGYNGRGQVGDGTTDNRSSPVRIGTSTWLAVKTSSYTTCGITTSHAAYCWGFNGYGQVGDGQVGDSSTGYVEPTPQKVSGSVAWSKITPGFYNSCGISTAGALYCWGYGEEGGVGNGQNDSQSTPTRVGTSSAWSTVTPGNFHVCGRAGVKAYCWGRGSDGALGNGSTDNVNTPTAVPGSWKQVNTLGQTTCGVTTTSVSKCWGLNGSGQVGDGTTKMRTSPRTLAVNSTSFSKVLSGSSYSCAIQTANAKIKCFGDNTYAEFGNGTTDSSPTPVVSAGGRTDWASVAVGDYHACGIRPTGKLLCWGDNLYGELGVGTTDSYTSPVEVGSTPQPATKGSAKPPSHRPTMRR